MPSTVAVLLGPYRNLSTLTASLLHLHPNAQALNHAGWRVLGQAGIDFFLSPDPEVLDRFVDFAMQASQDGRSGDYGGSILLSHAFQAQWMRDAYARRYGDRRIKDRVECLVWKESLRIGVHLREHAVDMVALISALPGLRFVLPVRHPLDTALSNLRSGHWALFPQLVGVQGAGKKRGGRLPSPEEVLGAVLEEILWFAALESAHPRHCFHFFEHELDRTCLEALARFLDLDPERKWLDEAAACARLKASVVHPPVLMDVYAAMVQELFADHPAWRSGLLRFKRA